jgi:hypothetical protein
LRASTGYPKILADVYTIAQPGSMNFFIDGGVDGMIITDNSQQQLVDIVNQLHQEVHLGIREDNPFQPLNEAYAVQVHTDNYLDSGTDAYLQFTLTGCRGSSTIIINTGFIWGNYDSARMRYGNDDWITIPSKDLGQLESITVENLGPDDSFAGWDLTEVHVSSARYIGQNYILNGEAVLAYQYSATYSQTIDVGDKVSLALSPSFSVPGPTIQCPSNIQVVNDHDQCGAVVYFAPTVSGPCDDVTATCNPASGSYFPVGTKTVTCYATNSVAKSAPCSFTVTVLNTQPPTIQCPGPKTVASAPGQCGAVVTFSPVVSGPCNDVTAVCNPASGSFFVVGQTPVACQAQSKSGPSSAPCFFMVTVQDTQPPVITCPAPIVVKATSPAGAVVSFAVTATDNCGATTIVSTAASGSVFAIGDTIVQSTATDGSANQSSCSFKVHVKGAAEQIADLVKVVNNLNLAKGPKNALLLQLNTALASLQSNNLLAACGAVQSFIDAVKALPSKTLSPSDAALLIAAATQISAVIGCK